MYRGKVTLTDQSNYFMWSSENVPTDKQYKSCSIIIHAAALILQTASVGPLVIGLVRFNCSHKQQLQLSLTTKIDS